MRARTNRCVLRAVRSRSLGYRSEVPSDAHGHVNESYRSRSAVSRFFRNPQTDRVAVAQFPNLPLAIFLVASVVRRVVRPDGDAGTAVSVVATGSLLWWAGDEVLRGASPFRRVLGAGVLVVTLAGVARRLT